MGTPDDSMPFDHVVCLMMENHSFDNYFGMLSRRGQPKADGFRFDRDGQPTATCLDATGRPVRAFKFADGCHGSGVSQSWDVTHKSVNDGRMDGWVTAKGDDQPMAYWDDETLPFYYSLASTFTLANRWFSSAPCQTYPNRRFLIAGTAFGLISTDTSSIISTTPPFIAAPPPNGTIFDRLNATGVTWKNYFTDLPAVGVVPSGPSTQGVTSPAVGFFIYADGLGPGLPVDKGDELGHVEMLGVRHDVRAPRRGMVRNLVTETGEAVEYGQLLIEMEPAE